MTEQKKSCILTGREFIVTKEHSLSGRLTWYTPTEYLKRRFASVLQTELTDTTSSAGDWSGYIVQRQGRNALVIPFCQENRICSFSLSTANRFLCIPFKNWRETLEKIELNEIQHLWI